MKILCFARRSPTSIAFTETECQLLDHLVPDKPKSNSARHSLSSYIVELARLGRYLARASDSPPGNIVMWPGLSRLSEIALGFEVAKLVGNWKVQPDTCELNIRFVPVFVTFWV